MRILFSPEPDITPFELATILANIISVDGTAGGLLGNTPIFCADSSFANMSPGVRRHWTVKQEN